MTALITDPHLEESLKAQRHAWGADRYDEVWEGVYIMSPQPNVEHQELISDLVGALRDVIRPPKGGKVYPGINLSDRADDWEDNYRCPDVAVFLPGNLAEKFKAHYRGPADFLVEIVSPNDNSREKIPFYSALGVRELLIIDRYPWSLELYRPQWQRTCLGGPSSAGESEIIASAILPLSFQLLPAQPRPQIRITEIGGPREWISKAGRGLRSADRDLLDHHAGMKLTVAGAVAVVLAATELLDDQLRTLHHGYHLGRDDGLGQGRPADLQPGLVAKGQHPLKLDLLAGREIAKIDVQFLALFHFQLAAAVFDDCVHE